MGIIKPVLNIVEKVKPSVIETGEKLLSKEAKCASQGVTNVFEHSAAKASTVEKAVVSSKEAVSKVTEASDKVIQKAVKTEYQIQRETEQNIENILSKYVKDSPEYKEYYQMRYNSMLKGNGGEPLDADDIAYLEQRTMQSYLDRYAENIKLPEAEEKTIADYVEKYKEYGMGDDYSLLENYAYISKTMKDSRSRVENDICYAINCNSGYYGIKEHTDSILQKFKDNEFAKCSTQQLYDIHSKICKSNLRGDELVSFLNSDFSEMANRNLDDIFELFGGVKNISIASKRAEEFRWCSPEVFARKRANLFARTEDVINGNINWQTILDMSDEDYRIYTQIKDSLPKSYEIKDIKQIAKSIEQNPEFTESIIKAGYREKDFSKLLELEKSNPELVRKLVSEKCITYKGMGYAHEVDEIETICELMKSNPELANQFLEGNRNFGMLKYITDSLKINKNLTNELLSIKEKNYSGKMESVFSEGSIKEIVEFNEKEPELVDILVHSKDRDGKLRFGGYAASNIIEIASKDNSKNLNLVKRLVQFKQGDEYRFDRYSIEKIIEYYEKNPELTESLLMAKKGDSYRYSANDMDSLMPLFEEDSALTTKILSLQDGRFDAWMEVPKLFKRFKEDEQLTNKLLEMDKNRFSADDIDELFPLYQENEKLADKLIHAKFYNNINFRFRAADVKETFESLKKDKNLTISLLRKTAKDSCGNTVYAFSPKTVNLMVSAKEHDGGAEIVNKLINMTHTDEKNHVHQLVQDESAQKILTSLLKGTEQEKSAVLNLFNRKEGKVFLSTFNNRYSPRYLDDNFLNQIGSRLDNNLTNLEIKKGFMDGTEVIETISDKGKKYLTYYKDTKGNYNILKEESNVFVEGGSKVSEKTQNGVFKSQKIDGEVIEREDFCSGKKEKLNIGYKQISSKVDVKDKSVVTEIIEPSKLQKGEFDIVKYSHNGNKNVKKEVLSSSKNIGKASKGIKTVKSFSSPSGVKTNVVRIQGDNGYVMNYEITAKGGKILGKINRHFTKINDHHYRSTLNGQKYDIIYNGDDIYVTKIGQNGAASETIKMSWKTLDPSLRKLYKQLPGDYFFKIKNSGLSEVKSAHNIIENACFSPLEKNIQMGAGLESNAFVFSHELGHALDMTTLKYLNTDPKLMEIYKREMEAYKKYTTNSEGLSIDYFTQHVNLPKTDAVTMQKAGEEGTVHIPENSNIRINGAIGETIAETHALLSGHINDSFSKLGMRSIVLQRNFPETIAYIMNKIVNC